MQKCIDVDRIIVAKKETKRRSFKLFVIETVRNILSCQNISLRKSKKTEFLNELYLKSTLNPIKG